MTKKLEMLNWCMEQRLREADVVCRDCGQKYGKYSVGCSSTWIGTCEVCGEEKGVTEVRDWGYLTKGINELKTMETETEIEKTITLEFTEDEIALLNAYLGIIGEDHLFHSDATLFESIEAKVTEAYEDNCVKYSLSPAIIEYNKKYGTWGTGEDAERWQKFKDNYSVLVELGFITEVE